MFNTLGSFSAVYFALAAVLFVLILFEKYFVQLEDKIRANRVKAKKAAKQNVKKRPVQKCRNNTVKSNGTHTYRKVPNNAA